MKVALQPPGGFEFPHSSLMWRHSASCIVPLDGRAHAASSYTGLSGLESTRWSSGKRESR
jgi:hypothetical protein